MNQKLYFLEHGETKAEFKFNDLIRQPIVEQKQNLSSMTLLDNQLSIHSIDALNTLLQERQLEDQIRTRQLRINRKYGR